MCCRPLYRFSRHSFRSCSRYAFPHVLMMYNVFTHFGISNTVATAATGTRLQCRVPMTYSGRSNQRITNFPEYFRSATENPWRTGQSGVKLTKVISLSSGLRTHTHALHITIVSQMKHTNNGTAHAAHQHKQCTVRSSG